MERNFSSNIRIVIGFQTKLITDNEEEDLFRDRSLDVDQMYTTVTTHFGYIIDENTGIISKNKIIMSEEQYFKRFYDFNDPKITSIIDQYLSGKVGDFDDMLEEYSKMFNYNTIILYDGRTCKCGITIKNSLLLKYLDSPHFNIKIVSYGFMNIINK